MGERLVMTRAHTAVLMRPMAVAVLASAILAVVVGGLAELSEPGALGALVAVPSAALAVVAVLRFVRRVWEWDRTLLVVTPEHLAVYRSGVRRTEQIVPLSVVSRLHVRRTLPGRLLGYGTIEVSGRGHGTRLRYVPDPDEVSAVISAYAGRRDLR
jgi:membrane protein YdbS with pleckstrin-like domain